MNWAHFKWILHQIFKKTSFYVTFRGSAKVLHPLNFILLARNIFFLKKERLKFFSLELPAKFYEFSHLWKSIAEKWIKNFAEETKRTEFWRSLWLTTGRFLSFGGKILNI